MIDDGTYKAEGIIISKRIQLPLNGEPAIVIFQIKIDDWICQYTGILKDYREEFIWECIGETVNVTLEPVYRNEIFVGYRVTEMEVNDSYAE